MMYTSAKIKHNQIKNYCLYAQNNHVNISDKNEDLQFTDLPIFSTYQNTTVDFEKLYLRLIQEM